MTDEAANAGAQPTTMIAALDESTDVDDLFDNDGRIKSSPANAENDR